MVYQYLGPGGKNKHANWQNNITHKAAVASSIIAGIAKARLIKNNENEIVVLNGEYQYYIKENPANKILVQAEVAPGLTYIHHAFNGKKLYMVKAAVEKTFQRNDTIYGNCFFYDASR